METFHCPQTEKGVSSVILSPTHCSFDHHFLLANYVTVPVRCIFHYLIDKHPPFGHLKVMHDDQDDELNLKRSAMWVDDNFFILDSLVCSGNIYRWLINVGERSSK